MLTERQKNLIAFLEEREDKVSANVLIYHIDGYEIKENPYLHDYCQELRNDAKAINESMDTERIIIYNRKNEYWICKSEKDLMTYIIPFRIKGIKSIQYYSDVLTKAMSNGQIKTDDYVTTRPVDIYESFSDKGNGCN